MLNRSLIILFVSVILLFSCKKEISDFDREDDLTLDTTAVLFSAGYVSHTTSQLSISVDMVVLNGLTTESIYNDFQFIGTPEELDLDFDFSSVSVNTVTAVSSYSSVFLINLNTKEWYVDNVIGFYLRRFLEQNEGNNNKKTALAALDPMGSSNIVFYKENPNLFFGNTWQYTMDEFYRNTQLVDADSYNPTITQILFLTSRLDEAIDSIALSSEPVGDKSITFFSGRDFDTMEDPTLYVNATIAKAITEGVRINLIGTSFNAEVKRLAVETGGFICEIYSGFNFNSGGLFDPSGYYSENLITPIEVGMQNLERLLSRNVTVHHCDLKVNQIGATIFQSNDKISYRFNYDNINDLDSARIVEINFVIP